MAKKKEVKETAIDDLMGEAPKEIPTGAGLPLPETFTLPVESELQQVMKEIHRLQAMHGETLYLLRQLMTELHAAKMPHVSSTSVPL